MNELPLAVALELLYLRHDGEAFPVSVFDWACSKACPDAAYRALLLSINRNAYGAYSEAPVHITRVGWGVHMFRPAEPDNAYVHIELIPPEEHGNH